MTARAGEVVAVIGAGPAGLVAARYLASEGFRPVLFDAADRVGGQWRVGDGDSGVWPGMRTNTSRITTAFSDLAHPAGTAAYPTGDEIGAYLQRFAASAGILADARFGCEVTEIEPLPDGQWGVTWRDAHTALHREPFARVVVASGRYRRPFTPAIEGLRSFTGSGGVSHVAANRGPLRFQGQRVLVAGHSISAVEVASELALKGAARVVVSSRRHRYVLQKLIAGVPIEHRVYTRYAALAARALPTAVVADTFRDFIVRSCGHPTQFGAPCHAENPYEAGFTQNQYYLPLVAEGRIHPRPWLVQVDGTRATFADGSHEDVDTIVCGTGYTLDLPFLGPAARAALAPDAHQVDLYDLTFHPDLPNLAVVGMFEQSGPYFTPLELQARWVAYTWSGRVAGPSIEVIREGLAACRARRGQPQVQRMHLVCDLFAGHAGVEPDVARWPGLERALLFGVQSPARFRLQGPDALADAAAQLRADVSAFGALDQAALTEAESAQLRRLSAV
ncbi:MAG: FAD-dependent oxidoreductase [Gemmatimonadetes bacterium]|nr:FAD-dependent oxidoreductase [Gemmatimonadota bacterium]